jgi:hypothetical protein
MSRRPRSIIAFGLSLTVHVLALLLWTVVATSPRAASSRQLGKTVAVFDATPLEDSRYPGLNPLSPADDDWFRTPDHPSPLSVGKFTFDVRKISEHAEVLFPFFIPGVALEHFTLAPRPNAQDHLGNPFLSAADKSHAPNSKRPLLLSAAAVQSAVDKAWSRHDRWRNFQSIKTLTDTYSPDDGRLPDILQAYREQNAFQPFSDATNRDPRVWSELEIAADHVSFIAFIRQYASDHPSTKVTTELLFLLERMAEASRNMLATVLNTHPSTQLEWTRAKNHEAYDLFVNIQGYYLRRLDRRGLTSEAAITEYFDKVRLAILTGILRTTPHGYRANDAHFLIGAIYWREHKAEDALASWHEMTPPTARTDVEGDSNVIAYTDVLRAIGLRREGAVNAVRDRALTSDIARILDAERGRWMTSSYERLRKFGFAFDSY